MTVSDPTNDETVMLRLADVEALLKHSAEACREQSHRRFGRRAAWYGPLTMARARVRLALPRTSGYFGGVMALTLNADVLSAAERAEGDRRG